MRRQAAAGFTLLELSIVLVLIALITGMGLSATLGALDSARRAATENKLDAIEAALSAFRISERRLPCPAQITLAGDDANAGVESEPRGDCISGTPAAISRVDQGTGGFWHYAEGAVPVKALNLPNDYMYDGWGRRFTYNVAVAYTSEDAFTVMHPKEPCGSNVYGDKDGANLRGTNAIYTLISHGMNGHGAYLQNGTRMGSGSTNTAEHYNCSCDKDLATTDYFGAVQAELYNDPANRLNSFDDHVRYKERWQMQTTQDDRVYGRYSPIQLVVGYSGGVTKQLYQKQCDNFLAFEAFDDSPEVTTSYIGFTPDNAHLFIYGNDDCHMYAINDNEVDSLSISTPSCPAYNAANSVAMSPSGYLAISHNASPFLRLWKYSGSAFNLLGMSFAPGHAPADQPTLVRISRNADQVFLSRSGDYATVYKRSDTNELSTIAVQPVNLPNDLTEVVYSPGGKYLAGTKSGNVVMWRIDTPATFTEIITVDADGDALVVGGGNDITALAFSPDEQYLALGSDGSGASAVAIYKIDLDNSDMPVFTKVTITPDYNNAAPIVGLHFTPDSHFLVGVEAAAGSQNSVINLKRQSALQFTYHGGTNAVPAGLTPTAMGMRH